MSKRLEREEFIKNGIEDCLSQNMKNIDIAKKLNISMTILSYWMKKLGLENNRYKYQKPNYGDMFGKWKF